MKAGRGRGVVFQIYSSLAHGRLTGKYSVGHAPPDSDRFSNYSMKKMEPTLEVPMEIAHRVGVSVAAVVLNYNINKDVVVPVDENSTGEAKCRGVWVEIDR